LGYLHIENLYRPAAQTILLFKQCYALEKVHGTSAHVAWRDNRVWFHSGGEAAPRFQALFDEAKLTEAFIKLGHPDITVFGEAYGGKQQGMRHTYGDALQFIVFDVKIGDVWMTVPNMADIASKLGLEAVPYELVSTDLGMLDAERDKPSDVAVRRGIKEPKPREGVVLRPLVELTTSNGNRVIAKHKCEAFSERKTPQKVDASKREVLEAAQQIADEWVTPMRLEHVLQRFDLGIGMEATAAVISAMIEDVTREASGEIVDSRDARSAIGRKTAELFGKRCKQVRTQVTDAP